MALRVNDNILPYLITAAEGDLVDNELWAGINGSHRRFEVFFEDCDSEIIIATFKDIKFTIRAEDGKIIQVSINDPETFEIDIKDIVNALCHPDSRVS